MQKSSIETFIQKYTLSGAINSVTLDSTNGALSVSGVTSDIPDNSQVMGYPAVPLRDFVKMRRKNEK